MLKKIFPKFAIALLILGLLPQLSLFAQIITTVAGRGGAGYNADGIAATAAQLNTSGSAVKDVHGNLFIADYLNNRIRKVDTSGIITTICGTGYAAYTGDGGPATAAQIGLPVCLIFDKRGNLYIADNRSMVIRKIDTGGIISTYAGTGVGGYTGDGGPATNARLGIMPGMCLDKNDNMYISQGSNHTVRKISSSGIITTYAGTSGSSGFSGDGGPASAARFATNAGLVCDTAGNLYIADQGNHRIRKVLVSGTISTFAGNGGTTLTGDGGPATAAAIASPYCLAADTMGNIYFSAKPTPNVRKINASGVISTLAGNGIEGYNGDGVPATTAQLWGTAGLSCDNSGNLIVAEERTCRIRNVDAAGIITTLAGMGHPGFSGDGGSATTAQLFLPKGIAVDTAGNLYIADQINNRIRKVDVAGTITTIAGNGAAASTGDGGPATAAAIYEVGTIALDNRGNLFITEPQGSRIRKIDASGIITTIAGNGTFGSSGDGGPATAALLAYPVGISVDVAGNLYVIDWGNWRLRKIDNAGIITTIAGTGVGGYAGDGGPASAAQLDCNDVAIDGCGNIYLQCNRPKIRMINTSGSINTIAGNGTAGVGGDGGPATNAQLITPLGIAIDKVGNLYIADRDNHQLRVVDTAGIINTISGLGTMGYTGDGGPATAAQIFRASAVTTDKNGNIYFSEYGNNTVRKISGSITFPNAGTVTGIDSICPGHITPLSASVSGGMWISSNPLVATVSASGVVTSLAPGITVIKYAVAIGCNSDTAFFRIYVRSYSACTNIAINPDGTCGISIYPNPTTGLFTLKIPSAIEKEARIIITNVFGEKVMDLPAGSNKENKIRLDVPAGVYFVRISVDREYYNSKIIVE